MTLQRENPLPPGRYWQDLFGPMRQRFAAWRTENKDAVDVLRTESFDSDPPREWVLFEVRVPFQIDWPQVDLGFPTIADETIESSDDTVQKPPPETGPDLGDVFGPNGLHVSLPMAAGVGLGALLLGFLLSRALK